MFERFTDHARAVVVDAQDHARRLGHHHIGSEHLLLAIAGSDADAGEIFRARGVAPDDVETALRRLLGAGPIESLDRDALASIGIDVDLVRDSLQAAFGADAVRTASARRSRHWWRRRGDREVREVRGHIPFTPQAKACLERSLREAQRLHDHYLGVEHLALALTSQTDGLTPRIFTALNTSGAGLRREILDRHRRAS
jgi:ATP-dependent Clp protease ATP-binding subunit ClpA